MCRLCARGHGRPSWFQVAEKEQPSDRLHAHGLSIGGFNAGKAGCTFFLFTSRLEVVLCFRKIKGTNASGSSFIPRPGLELRSDKHQKVSVPCPKTGSNLVESICRQSAVDRSMHGITTIEPST